jgi:hypothetical protein
VPNSLQRGTGKLSWATGKLSRVPGLSDVRHRKGTTLHNLKSIQPREEFPPDPIRSDWQDILDTLKGAHADNTRKLV